MSSRLSHENEDEDGHNKLRNGLKIWTNIYFSKEETCTENENDSNESPIKNIFKLGYCKCGTYIGVHKQLCGTFYCYFED